MRKQWTIVTSSLIICHISSILHYKHLSYSTMRKFKMWKQLLLHEQSKKNFQVEIGVFDRSADISKIRDKFFFCYVPKTN